MGCTIIVAGLLRRWGAVEFSTAVPTSPILTQAPNAALPSFTIRNDEVGFVDLKFVMEVTRDANPVCTP